MDPDLDLHCFQIQEISRFSREWLRANSTVVDSGYHGLTRLWNCLQWLLFGFLQINC